MKDLIQYLSENKYTNPNKVFIKHAGEEYTYKTIANRVNNLSANLYKPKQKQQYIGLLLDDSLEFIISFLAIQKNSDIAVLFSPNLEEELLLQKMSGLNLSKIIFHEKYRDIVNRKHSKVEKIVIGAEENSEVSYTTLTESNHNPELRIPFLNPENPSIIMFTSGTTGNPKNVLHSHKSLVSNALSCFKIINNQKSLTFLGYPDFANYISLVLVISLAIISSGTISIPKEKNPGSILQTIKDQQVNLFAGVPLILRRMVNHENNTYLKNLKFALSLNSPIDLDTVNHWRSKYQANLLQGYGLTESMVVSFNSIRDNVIPSSLGKAIPGAEMKVMNPMKVELPTGKVGELHIQSDSNLISYYNSDRNKNRHNRWFATGDLVRKDHEGYFHFIDRKSNAIHKKGFTIFPTDIEDVIIQHPKINRIHVMKLLGEKDDNIKFCIIPNEEEKLEKQEIKDYAQKKLPHFLQPEFIEIYKDFKENYLGNILRDKFIHSH